MGYVSLRASSPFLASRTSCERTRKLQALLSRAAHPWLLASFSNQESLPAGWGHLREISQVLLVRLVKEPYFRKRRSCFFCPRNQLEEAKLNKDIPHEYSTVGTRCTFFLVLESVPCFSAHVSCSIQNFFKSRQPIPSFYLPRFELAACTSVTYTYFWLAHCGIFHVFFRWPHTVP